jgi:hypothetical protein
MLAVFMLVVPTTTFAQNTSDEVVAKLRQDPQLQLPSGLARRDRNLPATHTARRAAAHYSQRRMAVI